MQGQQLPQGMFVEDAQAIQRRRAALAGIMAQAAPQQGRMVGGRYIRGNGLSQIAALIAGAMSKDNTSQMETDARAKYQADLRGGMEDYFTQRDGRSGAMNDQQAGDLMERDMAPILPEPVAADPRQAVIGAMSSRHPELRALGQADLTRMGARGGLADVKELLPYVNPSAIPALIKGGVGAFQPKTGKMDVTDVSIGNGQWQSFETGPDGRVDMTKPIGEPFAKKPTASVTHVTLPGAVPEPLAKAQPKNFEEIRGTAQSAIRQVQSADRLEKLAADPQIISGALAKPELFLTSLATRLGFTGPDAASKTQAMLREMAQGTLSNVKMLPGPLSEKELPFLEAATSGQIEFTPEVLLHIARLQKVAAHNSLMDAYQLFESNSKLPGGDAYAQAYRLPRQGSYQLDPSVYSVDEGNFATLAPAAGIGAKPARPQPTAPSAPIVKNW